MNKNVTLEARCTGFPNFFVYGIEWVGEGQHNAYCLVDNQHWMKLHIPFSNIELDKMVVIETQSNCWVNE